MDGLKAKSSLPACLVNFAALLFILYLPTVDAVAVGSAVIDVALKISQ
jgi:hypothetical protein